MPEFARRISTCSRRKRFSVMQQLVQSLPPRLQKYFPFCRRTYTTKSCLPVTTVQKTRCGSGWTWARGTGLPPGGKKTRLISRLFFGGRAVQAACNQNITLAFFVLRLNIICQCRKFLFIIFPEICS